MTTQCNGNVETWMLFSSENATRVDVALHQPGERRHSTKVAHIIKGCDAAMEDAAQRGCNAAFDWLRSRDGAVPAYSVSFDLPDVEAGHAALGGSRVERKPAPLGAACFSIEHTTTAAALSEWLRHNLRTAHHRGIRVARDGASGAIELVFDGGFD